MMDKNLGIYCSHREDINGSIESAVKVSNEKDYLVWLEKSIINPEKFSFPTTIVIKITKEDRYYRGILIDVKRVSEVDVNEILSEEGHRPPLWLKIDREFYNDFKSILYIQKLMKVHRPKEVENTNPPQRPIYINL